MQNKIQIGINETAQRVHESQSHDKLAILNKALLEFARLTNDFGVNVVEFEIDFVQYTINHFKRLNAKASALGIPDAEFCRMFGVDLTIMNGLLFDYSQSNGSIIFKDKGFVINESFDFGIYAETPSQIERLNDSKELIELLKKLHSKYFLGTHYIQKIPIGIFYMQDDKGDIIPNVNFIKNA